MTVENNLAAFCIGGATAYFLCLAYHILKGQGKSQVRLHKLLGYIFIYWAASNAKDLLLTFPGTYSQPMLDVVTLCDGWSALTFLVLLYELTMPGWTTLRRLALTALPFVGFTVAYLLHPAHELISVYTRFLCVSSGLPSW